MIGPNAYETRLLAKAIGAEHLVPPHSNLDRDWHNFATAPTADHVVLALWADEATRSPLNTINRETWTARAEQPLLRWILAFGAASQLCSDGGAIIALVDGSPPLDAAGLAPEAAISEAVYALVRSLALAEGSRGVRVNLIVTPFRLHPDPIVAPAPPLPGFPGTLENDVIPTVRLLLSQDAQTLTAQRISTDRGRTW